MQPWPEKMRSKFRRLKMPLSLEPDGFDAAASGEERCSRRRGQSMQGRS